MNSVGIFWFVDETLVFKAVSIADLMPDEIGLIDSPYKHINEWEHNHLYNQFGLTLYGTEYQSFPRGRVVYDTNMQLTKVFIDKSIYKKSITELIANQFNIDQTNCKWFSDPHYCTFNY